MLNLKKLLEALKAKITEIEQANAKVRELEGAETPDEEQITAAKAVRDNFKAEYTELEKQVEEAKEHAARQKVAAELEGMAKAEPVAPAVEPTIPAQAKTDEAEDRELEVAFLDYFAGKELSGKAREALRPTHKKIIAGEGAKGVRVPERLMKNILAAIEGKTMYSTANPAAPATNPSAAQNLVPPTDFRANLLRLALPTAAILDRTTIVRSRVGSVTWPRLVQTDANDFGFTFQWLTEGEEKPETEPTFEQVVIQSNELAGYTEIHQNLLRRSAIDLEALLEALAGGGLRYTLDNAIVQGTGVGQPLGIPVDPAVRAVARSVAGQVSYADIVNLKHAILPHHRMGSEWAMHDDVEARFENTLDGQGRPLFQSSVATGPYDRFLGYPYFISMNCQAEGDAGDIIFGNLAAYFTVIEEEVVMARSEHYRFRQDLVAYRMYLVAGGRAVLPRALAYLEGAAS